MAEINVGVNKTNDPSYLNSSQGTDRASLQPLASVPDLNLKIYQPDHKVDRSAGTAVKGLGDIFEAGVKLTDQIITKKASDVLSKGIDEIRDSFGVAQAAAQSSDIGKATEQGTPLNADTTANQPIALNRLGNKVEGLTEAYRQGGLSNSAYYAKLEAFVRETKAQFGGAYNDQIDSIVSSKVGTTPANALRASLQADVAAVQDKVQKSTDKWTSYENQNTQYIHTVWPNYEQLKAEGRAPNRLEVEAAVGKLQASDYAMDSKLKRLSLGKAGDSAVGDQAYDLALQKASEISRNVIIGTTNTMGIKTSADLMKYMADVRAGTRKPPTPDEKELLTGMFATLKQNASAEFDKFANTPLSGNTTETLASKLRDPARLAAAKQVALADIGTIEDGLLNEKHGLVFDTIRSNKANDAQADRNLSINMPNADIAGALRRKLGNDMLTTLAINDKIGVGQDLIYGLRQAGWVSLDGKRPAHETISKLSQDDPSGVASKQYINDAKQFVIQQEKLSDKTLGDRAFLSLFGPGNTTLVDSFKGKTQVAVFTDMASTEMTKAVQKRSKEDQSLYVNWVNDGFISVFATQAMGANQSAANYKINGNLTLKFDPNSGNFRYEGKGPPGILNNANASLQPLNTAINTMKEVFKMQGKAPLDEVYRLLPVMGIEPGSPIYKAIQDEYIRANPPKEG
jgi:hypothetical protein